MAIRVEGIAVFEQAVLTLVLETVMPQIVVPALSRDP
jgi:hypothetical protein